MKASVLIVDDHTLVRRGLVFLLQAHPEWEVCDEASSGQEAVDKASQLRPDVVIMDISMPGMSGLEATRRIRGLLPETEVLIVTMHESHEIMQAARQAGARGCLVKSASIDRLVEALEAVRRHESYFPQG